MTFTARRSFAIVLVCFLLSGMAGLVYQVVWTRYLALFLGHTSYAVVAVLVAFMGGLALGNAWVGAAADRQRQPLALYGWLELGIAGYAVFFPFYYQGCNAVFLTLASRFEPGSGGVQLLKFVFSLATVLFPTILMGATFPVLARFVTRSLVELRERVAALYFINSLGAVLGCLLADFWWIPAYGLRSAVYAGGALNFCAGIVALCLSKQLSEPLPPFKASPDRSRTDELFSPDEMRLAVVGIGLSGFVAMLYEVAWTRVLALALGASTHAFSLMLITFISGIALGAWIVYRWSWTGRSLIAFAWAEMLLGLSVLGSMFFYADVPFWFLRGASFLSRQPGSYPIYELLQAAICFGIMIVPTACLGVTLPLVSRIATSDLAGTGRSVGRVFAVNTLGTVLGAVFTGLWILPWLGLARTFGIGIIVNVAIAGSILFRPRAASWRKIAAGLTAAASFGFLWLIGALLDPVWQPAFSAGLWRSPQPPATLAEFRETGQNGKILYYKDGAAATVTVISKRRGDRDVLILKVNGKTDAASAVDVTTQRLLAHIPMFLCPNSKEALVVGMGSGMTAAGVARHPSIDRVDVVEISPEVVQAAHLFGNYNDRFWQNPKIKVTVDDAKSFLRLSRKRYDAIISEPSNPWMAGVAGVFSQEYYRDCRDHLRQNGVMAQWVQMYETSDELLDVVLRTFGSVFPYLSIWETSPADLVLIGSEHPLKVDVDAMRTRFQDPAVKSDLAQIEIASLPVLLAREAVSRENGAYVALQKGPLHSDFHPVLEFQAARAFFSFGRADRWRYFDEKLFTRPATVLGEYLRNYPLTEEDFKAIGRFYLEYGLPEPDLFRSMLFHWQRERPDSLLAMELMGQVNQPVMAAELESLRLAPLTEFFQKLAQTDPEPLRQYESYLMQTYRVHRSVFNQPPTVELETVIKRLLETNPANQRVYKCHLAEIAGDKGDDSRLAELAKSAFDRNVTTGGPATFAADSKAPQLVLLREIAALLRSGKIVQAWSLCQEARRENLLENDPWLELTYRKLENAAAHEANFGRN